jgi:hypothetical protein
VEVLAVDQPEPTDVHVSATHLYWTNYGTYDHLDNYQHDGTLTALALNGGEVDTLASALDGPTELVLDASAAYVALNARIGSGSIVKVPLTGETYATVVEGVTSVEGLAFDDVYLYWFSQNDDYTWTLMRAPKNPVGSEPAEGLTIRPNVTAGSLAVDADHLYWFEMGDPVAAAKDGSDPQTLESVFLISGPDPLLPDGPDLFWGVNGPSYAGLDRLPKAGGDLMVLARLEDGTTGTAFGLDANWVYWSYFPLAGGAALMRSERTPGETLAILRGTALHQPLVALDETALYILNRDAANGRAATLMRLPMP